MRWCHIVVLVLLAVISGCSSSDSDDSGYVPPTGPDLSVALLTVSPDNIFAGNPATIETTVQNLGLVNNQTQLKVRVLNSSQNAVAARTFDVPRLDYAATRTYSFTVSLPAGQYYAVAYVELDGDINEDNNARVTEFFVNLLNN
ncbi:MAG: hypothetical protein PF961_05825 [Planctomycetota bacterium]|jgi:hypothetical protein|nr:hypothetical protein [Planctomycetota bacterium]